MSWIKRTLARLPWRFRSRNNLMASTANWYFNQVRRTPPQPVARQSSLEIHSLVCHRDVNMMLTSAKSFIRYLPDAALVLHDDGSTTAEDQALFAEHLPGVLIISRAEADAAMRLVLPAEVFAKRQQYIFLLKLFDFNHFHQGTRMILLDSDIVFLSEPAEIVNWASLPSGTPFYNLDWCNSYRALRVPEGVVLPTHLNAGFMGYDGLFSMEEIWRTCQSVDYWLEDQTIYALLLAGRNAAALDPVRYCVYTGGKVSPDTSMLHFISPCRFTTLLYPRVAKGVYGQLGSWRKSGPVPMAAPGPG